jgi:hypothetical protein
MAKVNVEFDTVEKTISVKLDGKQVPDVVGVNLQKSYYSEANEDAFSCSIVSMTKDEDNDTRTYTQVMAKESKEAQIYDVVASKAFLGFVESRQAQKVSGSELVRPFPKRVEQQILAFLKG